MQHSGGVLLGASWMAATHLFFFFTYEKEKCKSSPVAHFLRRRKCKSISDTVNDTLIVNHSDTEKVYH